jgi:hypothetical protein
MSVLIFNMLLLAILFGINPTIANALNMIDIEPGSNTSFGGLSTESTDIAEANKTNLIRNDTNDNGTDFGGLSPRSVNIIK